MILYSHLFLDAKDVKSLVNITISDNEFQQGSHISILLYSLVFLAQSSNEFVVGDQAIMLLYCLYKKISICNYFVYNICSQLKITHIYYEFTY